MSNEMKDWLTEEAEERKHYFNKSKNAYNLRRLSKRHYKRAQIKRWSRQRITRGFSDFDVWNLDQYLLDILPKTIEHLADTTHGYPGVEPWETPEKWEAYLRNIAKKLKEADYLINADFPVRDFNDLKDREDRAHFLVKEALAEIGEVFFSLWD